MTPSRPDLDVIIRMVPKGARVLDLGCGDGTLLAELVEKQGVQGRGVEVDEANVRACVSRGLSVRHGNIEEGLADFPDGMFDVVILSQTVAYLNRPLGVLEEMARVGRSAIISFENAGYWRARWRAVRGRGGGSTLASGLPRIRSITLPQFQETLQQLGLRTEESILLNGSGQVRRWPTIRARAAVYRVARFPSAPPV
ncbi:MAG: methyltransferase domain-containing protein [candidate division NC10 bacterium]|nr:methyltransferase domain-containing protein [candidate division NC10 bacterium]